MRWADYETAYGNAAGTTGSRSEARRVGAEWGSVGDQLIELASDDLTTALTASNRLWGGLCHQHAYLSTAALPALPFLIEVLEVASNEVVVEILDILVGFAECSRTPQQDWVRQLLMNLVSERHRFEALAASTDPEISAKSRALLERLDVAA